MQDPITDDLTPQQRAARDSARESSASEQTAVAVPVTKRRRDSRFRPAEKTQAVPRPRQEPRPEERKEKPGRNKPVPRPAAKPKREKAAPTPRREHRSRLRPLLRGEEPTQTIPLRGSLRGTPYRDPRVTRAVAEEQAATTALDLALRVAELMLRSGSSSSGVETAAIAVGVAAGLEDLDVDLTMQSLHMQCRTPSGQTISRLRVVRQPRQDFARLAMVHALVDDLISGDIDVEQADAKIKEINTTRRTWSRWVVALGEGSVAGGVALILGASILGVLLAMLSGVLIIMLAGWVARIDLPDFYLGALGGALATVIAFLAYVYGPINGADFAFVVAGGIVALLPSRTLTSATEDLLSGFPVTGTARLFAVMFHTLGLIIGVASGLGISLQLAVALELGFEPPGIDKLAWASAPVPIVIGGAVFIGFAGALTLQNNPRMLPPAAILCALGVTVALASTDAGLGRVTSTGLAAVVIGFFARLIALRMDSPPITLFVPASFGLYPGLGIFIGLYHLTSSAGGYNLEGGLVSVFSSLGVIMAIATGATLGDRLATPLDAPVAQRRKQAVEAESDRRTDEGWEIV
ncbi:threonine/serine exporter family protein [Janibacter cremeus]|uniref:threonine/serine exporter family protein n=1 Tax=Janibacter cremeus TaxID=1285192 RepID=UPI0023F977D8|nr:threonine/serine exporter family protein [Janibacter cremeus]WEV77726.1 threonine/serine exporter family protein [Janibacter cremeus]